MKTSDSFRFFLAIILAIRKYNIVQWNLRTYIQMDTKITREQRYMKHGKFSPRRD